MYDNYYCLIFNLLKFQFTLIQLKINIIMKLFCISIAFFALSINAKAQTSPIQPKSTTPKTVDKNVKKLEKKTSKAEMLMERNPQQEVKTEEQARPNPLKSKSAGKALNPQPFPPADKNLKKGQNIKQKSKL